MIDPDRVVEAFQSRAGARWQSAKDLAPYAGRVYAMGRNDETLSLMAEIELAGLVDDFTGDTSWSGLPIIRSDQLPRDALVVNCSTSISPVSVDRRLRSLADVECVAFASLCRDPQGAIKLPLFVREAREDLTRNRTRYASLFERLRDPDSRAIFNKLMSYRLTGDYGFMADFSVRMADQYFEDFLPVPTNATFADCGGFDGDTTEQFVLRYPDFGKVFLFEPAPKNLQKAKVRLRSVRDVEFIPLGLSDVRGTLYFDPNSGSASSVSTSGSSSIEVTTLDAAVCEPLSFIKMDLEGWEIKALKGAEGHIGDSRPILAIAVYHSVADFWRVPDYVLAIRDDYDIAVRHYTEGWSETVMYFIPRAS